MRRAPAHGRDHFPAARALAALALANARFWPTVAPQTRAQLRHWRAGAQAIEDPRLRALALAKLRTEGMNAQAAAIAATLAPSANRAAATRAIVALELLFDYLDGVTEGPLDDPLADGERLFAAMTGAFAPPGEPGPTEPAEPYLRALAASVRDGMSGLPAREAVAEVARECAQRTAQAQIRLHAVPALGREQLAEWAHSQAGGDALGWRERAAGAAAAVLTLHALIAAAADPATTAERARAIDEAYVSTCALATLLDGVVDGVADRAGGLVSYSSLYADETELAAALALLAREGVRACAELRGGAHHLMMLAGVVAYWWSAPGASRALAAPEYAPLRMELGSLVFAPLLVMRAWRAGRRMR